MSAAFPLQKGNRDLRSGTDGTQLLIRLEQDKRAWPQCGRAAVNPEDLNRSRAAPPRSSE